MKHGLYCSAGYDWFVIGSEGRVSVCNALLYRTDNDSYLGNIIHGDVKLRDRDDWYRCPKQECKQICDRHWSRKRIYKDDVVIDEQDIVRPQERDGHTRFVSILFTPTWKCNYSCKYCGLPEKKHYPNIPDACDTHRPEVWTAAFDRFFELNKISGGLLQTHGGEPLYYDGIDVLFKYFHDKNFKIGLTTNLSADAYKKIVMAAPPSTFASINCSLHPSDKNFKWEHFKNRVQLLKVLGYNVSVNFVGHPDQIMLVPDYAEWCKSIHVEFALIPLLGSCDGIDFKSIEAYPEPLKNIIYKYSKLELTDKNRFLDGKRMA